MNGSSNDMVSLLMNMGGGGELSGSRMLPGDSRRGKALAPTGA